MGNSGVLSHVEGCTELERSGAPVGEDSDGYGFSSDAQQSGHTVELRNPFYAFGSLRVEHVDQARGTIKQLDPRGAWQRTKPILLR
ncbi:hypothetical protein Ate01nite_26810 [Actinoplanes teichomyceticus]|nr:hypothetical protein Ate01nite_26810 [Actinoplanes teichomyceticus]